MRNIQDVGHCKHPRTLRGKRESNYDKDDYGLKCKGFSNNSFYLLRSFLYKKISSGDHRL